MTITTMGDRIRKLRKEKGISQEILAQYLGISFQAVSKWENGSTMPDVSMIPAIASFFEVSTDELFDYDRMKTEETVQAICDDACACRDHDPEKAEKILKEGLKKFPGNVWILNNLLYPLMEQEGREDEVIRVAQILTETSNIPLAAKLDAFRILAETYHKLGDINACRNAIEKIPELYFSAVELKAKLLTDKERLRNAWLQQQISGYTLIEMQMILAELYESAGDMESAGKKYATAVRLIDAFEDDIEPLEGVKLCDQPLVKKMRVKSASEDRALRRILK